MCYMRRSEEDTCKGVLPTTTKTRHKSETCVLYEEEEDTCRRVTSSVG